MPRKSRSCPAGFVYHIWNRAAGRLRIFKKPGDYLAFEKILQQAHLKIPLPILDWCIMPNHWHFVVQPATDSQVTDFFRWLTLTHSMRWHTAHGASGSGPLYQGRFKSLPVEQDLHLLTLLRYVGRNPVRAKLVTRSQDWQWSGEHVRRIGPPELKQLLTDWPVDRPAAWTKMVNQPTSHAESAAIREALKRGRPFGNTKWTEKTAAKLGLKQTLRPRGRPPAAEKDRRPL